MAARASTGDLSRFDDDPPFRGGGGQRWDRERFERMRGGRGGGPPSGLGSSRGGDEHDHYRFQERDRFPGGRRDIDFHEDIDRRGPRVMERERFHEEDRFDRSGPSRRRTELFHDPSPSEIANTALAPYRRKSVVEKDIDISVRRPARPQAIRRQSSLDTFDRRPLKRYDEYDREEWRPPTNVPIPLPIRRRSPPRRSFHPDDDFEEIRYREFEREREPRGRDFEEFREVEVKREKSRRRRSRSRAARSIAATSVRSSSTSSFETVEVPASTQNVIGKKGKTRMPKRLVKKQAVIELGYPFEEEDDFIIVKRALEKDHIDEIIKISENYKEEKTTYVYEEKRETVQDLPPPPPQSVAYPPPPPTVIHAPPPPPQSVYAQSVRNVSPSRHSVYEERIEESNHIAGPVTVFVPGRGDPRESRHSHSEHRHEERSHSHHDELRLVRRDDHELVRSERDIKDEIRALEAERRMLKYEREGDYEFIERREPKREVVRIEKDRKGRRKPDPKVVAAMMATLT